MPQVGSRIGHIRLEAPLGVGGMGEVYRGFDEKLERVVAVKTIRAEHRLSGDARARFLREARILSKLAHPAICQVYDLIECDDADYLVLEFVEGSTLDELARSRRLPEREVLELGARIAEALAVAHRERIVHRDLKPANIMVTTGGTVKILDFGIARSAAGAEAALPLDEAASVVVATPPSDPAGADPDRTFVLREDGPTSASLSAALTQQGVIVGTVRYMSPEQASGQELSEASDLFSLGIVLQELLTGHPAYPDLPVVDLLLHVMRNECLPIEGVDPEVARLVEDLKHPIPHRRPTAEEALDRLRHILARPARMRRRRLRIAVAATAFVVLVVVLFVVSVLAVRAEHARGRAEELAGRLELEAERANREATTSNRVVGFLVDLFEEADPEQARGRDVTVREIVERGGARIGSSLGEEPLVRARLQNTLGSISWRLGDYAAAAALLEQALATVERERGGDDAEVAVVLSHLGAVYADMQRPDDALRTLVRARRLFEAMPSPPAPDLARTLNSLGVVELRQGDLAAAEERFLLALELRRGAERVDEREVAGTLNNLAILAWQRADFATAEEYYRQALAIEERRLGVDDPRLVAPLNNMGILLRDQRRYAEAENLHRRALAIAERALGPDHPDVAAVLSSLARLYGRQDRLVEGIALLERALGIARAAYGAEHPETGTILVRLGDLVGRVGDLARAERLVDRGHRTLKAALGDRHPRLVESYAALGRVYRDQRRLGSAVAALEQAERVGVAVLGTDHPDVIAVRAELAALAASPHGPA